MKNVKENNRKIAYFMGYIHYHPGIDIDDGTVGGIYNRFEIFSKTPIIAEEYPEDDQYYFASLPNPEYGKKGKVTWNRDSKTLYWDTLNPYMEVYLRDVKYHEKWDWLMPVAKRIVEIMYDHDYNPYVHSDIFKAQNELECELMNVDFEAIYKAIIQFIDAYNYYKK